MDLAERDHKLRSLREMQKKLINQKDKLQHGGATKEHLKNAVNNIIGHLTTQGKLSPNSTERIRYAKQHIYNTIG